MPFTEMEVCWHGEGGVRANVGPKHTSRDSLTVARNHRVVGSDQPLSRQLPMNAKQSRIPLRPPAAAGTIESITLIKAAVGFSAPKT